MTTTQAPMRECSAGCGRRRRTWRTSWTCGTCLPSAQELLVRARGPESMRAQRRAMLEAGAHDA